MKRCFTAKVVTLNILAHEADYGKHTYPYYGEDVQSAADYTFARRLEYIKAMFAYAHPDIVLMQEVSGPDFWGKELKLHKTETSGVYTSEAFPEFVFVNHGNRRGVLYEDNHMPQAFDCHNFVLFDPDKYRYISGGTRFASEDGTYESSWTDNGRSGQRPFNDLGDYTWAVLEEKVTGLLSIYASTHVYPADVQRYAYLVQQLQYMTEYLEQVSAEYGNAPVTIAGDFNLPTGRINSQFPYQYMTETAHYTDSNVAGGNEGTIRCFGHYLYGREGAVSNGTRIDYIFSNGGQPKNYEVLGGMAKLEEDGRFIYVPKPVFDGSMYDISDHQGVYVELVVDEDTKLQSVDSSAYYENPHTQKDKVVETDVLSNISLGDKLEADVVEDKEKGKVLRIRATDELNHVRAIIDCCSLMGEMKVSNCKKLTVSYKTEYSLYGVKASCYLTLGEKDLEEGISTSVHDTAGRWKTLSLSINPLSGILTQVGILGKSFDTGLLKGDAIYIASIELE